MDIALFIFGPVVTATIIGGGAWFLREKLGWFRAATNELGEDKPESEADAFDKERYRHVRGMFPLTNFPIEFKVAGTSAPARTGAVAKGDGLVVLFQDEERNSEGLSVWLSVENFSTNVYRWFGCTVTAYGRLPYDEIRPEQRNDGSPYLFQVYPGEQYTCHYFFPFPPHVSGPKFMVCGSWDKQVSFWWAHGA